MPFDPALAHELLDGRYPCILTTLTASGAPHSTVVWCSRDGDRIVVNGGEDVVWMQNLQRDPRVSAVVLDTEDMLRYVNCRGRVVAIEEDDGYAHIDELARLYDETDEFIWHRPGAKVRYRVTIEPELARTYDPETPPEVRRGPTRSGRWDAA